MTKADIELREVAHQKALLTVPVGQTGSGAARYGAAMYFYQRKAMSAELLEIYRRCCKFDHEDPIDLAAFEGIPNEVRFEV